MATKENVFVNVVTEFNGKALLKGQKQLSSFDKTIKNLGKSFATVFGAQAILNFSKNAINAFMKDEAAAKSLATQLKNMGFGFAATEVEGYIANLEKSTGVLDDHLRPALQTLITATGSLTQSQKALSIALDVSAATGKSVEEVSMALAKGFSGQTTAISRLGAGIDAATLKTGDMNKIMGLLQQKFAGQAKARLTTYAGKMDLLQGAAARASETIGKSLLDSISALSGDTGIQGAADAMESLATQTANTVYGFSLLIAQAKKLVGITGSISKSDLFMAIPVLGSYLSYAQKKGANARAAETQTNVGGYGGIPTAMEAVRIKEWYAIKNSVKLRTAENALLTKKTAVDQLKDKFDLERIGLTAALNSATDEETKLRLRAQLAILDNNEALAKKYLAEMNAAEAAKTLGTAAIDAANALGGILRLLGVGGDQGPTRALDAASVNYPSTLASNAAGSAMPTFGRSIGDQNPNNLINVTVNANNLIDPNQLAPIIQDTILRINRAGNQIQSTGGL
jgi:hypothetical protein